MPSRAPRAGSARAYDPSPDRQTLRQLLQELTKTLQPFCDHDPLVQGSLQTLHRRCGKERCRCARGLLHQSDVFVERGKGTKVIRKIRSPHRAALKKPTQRYSALRRSRARLSRLHREVLCCCDRLSRYRLALGRLLLDRLKGR